MSTDIVLQLDFAFVIEESLEEDDPLIIHVGFQLNHLAGFFAEGKATLKTPRGSVAVYWRANGIALADKWGPLTRRLTAQDIELDCETNLFNAEELDKVLRIVEIGVSMKLWNEWVFHPEHQHVALQWHDSCTAPPV